MTPDTAQADFSTRGLTFLRWMRKFFFITGALALAYVALTLLHARFFQQKVQMALDRQIDAPRQVAVSLPPVPAKEGDVLGRIEIPRLDVRVAILEGDSSPTLRLGVGHIQGTALPGQHGNIGLAGHRDTFFRALRDVRAKDEIHIQTATGITDYAVDSVQIVAPSDTAVLAPSTDSAVTLVTCYPFYFVGPAPKRFIVHAHETKWLHNQ